MKSILKENIQRLGRTLSSRCLMFFCLFCLTISFAEAQNGNNNTPGVVKGKVIDRNDGSSLIGCTVQVKGKKTATITNIDGVYQIQAAPDDVLIFSYMGYKDIEVKANSTDARHIVMDVDTYQMEDVVITGYQKLKKFNVTGAVNTLDNEKIAIRSSVGLQGVLEGAVPGLSVYNNDIKIRGGASLNAGNVPLFIVDDFEVQELPENMDEIASITVLKDAAATAIWGSRAANGVIVITTKSGQAGKMKVSYSDNFRFSSKPNFDDLNRANTQQLIDFDQAVFENGYYAMMGGFGGYNGSGYSLSQEIFNDYWMDMPLDADKQAEMDQRLNLLRQNSNRAQIEDYLMRSAFQQQHYLSLSGGSDKVNYYLSGSFIGGHSNYAGDKYQSVSINSRNTYKILPVLKLRADLTVAFDKKNNGYTSLSDDIYGLYPFQMLVDQEGNRVDDYSQFSRRDADMLTQQGYLSFGKNLINEVDAANNKTNTANAKARFGFDFHILEGLDLSADYMYEKYTSSTRNIRSIASYDVRELINTHTQIETNGLSYRIPKGDILDNYRNDINSWIFKVGATLNKTFGKRDEHYINAVAGFEMRDRHAKTERYRKLGYNDQLQSWTAIDAVDLATNGTIPAWSSYPYTYDSASYDRFGDVVNREVSYFFSGVYTYDNRYTASASLRIDKSNLFGVSKKYRRNPIWAFGANWNIKNEKFFKCNAIHALMLRASFGLTGNFDRSGSTTPVMIGRFINSSMVDGGGYMRIVTPPNPLLRWERTRSFNTSIDFGLFDRLNTTVTYYNNHSYDLLGEQRLDPTVGYDSQRINAANMINNGIEVALNADIIRTRNFTWNINWIYGYNHNKVTKNDIYESDPVLNRTMGVEEFVEGYAREALWSYRWAGLNEIGMPQAYKADGSKTAIPTEIVLEDIEFSGTYLPKHTGSISTGFHYKGLQANFLFTYNFGHVFRVEYPDMNPFAVNPAMNKMIADRWQKPGDEKYTEIPAIMPCNDDFWTYYDGLDKFTKYSSNSIRNGNMFRFREILLNYELPRKCLSRTPISRWSLTAQFDNICLWTANKEGYDPESVSPVNGAFSLTAPFTFTFGMKLDF